MKEMAVIHQQRVLNKDFAIYNTSENPLFLAKEVAEWIEHNKPSEMTLNVDDDEKLKAILSHSGQNREMWFLTEDGLYEVLMQSRKPIAKQFKKQVKAILKEIRVNGAYVHAGEDDDEITILAKGMMAAQRAMDRKDKVIEEQKQVLLQQRPKVVYAEAVEVSNDTILVKELAAILTQKGIDIGEKRLFDWLRENSYLCKQKGDMWNMPTQRSLELGVIVVKHGLRTGNGGEMRNTRTSKITGKGQIYFVNKFLNKTQLRLVE